MGLLWPLAAAAGLTALLVWPLRSWLLRRELLDHPDPRRSHRLPTPRGGGLAMAAAMACVLVPAAAGQGLPVLVAVLALAGLGWLDDVRDLAVAWRLLFQLLIAVGLLLYTGPVSDVSIFEIVLAWPWLWSILALVAVIWLINLHNFMDGSDGLAAMQGAWAGLALGALLARAEMPTLALTGFILAGACLGFLAWNRPPARVFMGDTGSVMIGGMIALLALGGAADGTVSIWQSLIVCSLFVVDATATLAARVVRGARWYTAHRDHAYQRLIGTGWGHGRVLVLYTLVNVLVVLPVLLLAIRYPFWDMALALGLIGALAGLWGAVYGATKKETVSR
ncbi:MAG: MraY family glycosyltransferase [Wenzhouxiangella sp.]